ncbi:SAM-dependent chlorinase/fluorinase [Candidatus Roizmanbacteria bacterium]|nr:SAM-dependent chlorinase/fluorinase [Candidatus Roizmanbacteria bacterium]
MNNKVITLISDFNDTFSSTQMELMAHSINPLIKFIVAENNVTPFSIIEGAFLLSKLYSFAPPKSIHIGVVDPGVGSDRHGLVIKTKNYWFIGPDNGILYPAAKLDGIQSIFTISKNTVKPISYTFHGRDLFAKVASYISKGKNPLNFCNNISKIKIKPLKFKKNQVLHIDAYGNIKFNAQSNGFRIGDKVNISRGKVQFNVVYCQTFSDVTAGKLLLYNGSHQTLELALNLGSAAKKLDAKVGDILQIQKL